jgi:hypothetical protein
MSDRFPWMSNADQLALVAFDELMMDAPRLDGSRG